MDNRKKYKKGAHGRDGGQFAAIPHQVLNSRAYLSLGAYAVKLLIDLFVQYKGYNNGDLCLSFSVMQKRGWKSKETLNNAKSELIAAVLIAETRKDMFPNKASLYGVTWLPMDDCNGKLDMPAQSFPRGGYKRFEPLPVVLKNKLLCTKVVPTDEKQVRQSGQAINQAMK